MGDEFYAIIKLVSGEEVLSLIMVIDENDGDPIIIMQNPIIIKMLIHLKERAHQSKTMDGTHLMISLIRLDLKIN